MFAAGLLWTGLYIVTAGDYKVDDSTGWVTIEDNERLFVSTMKTSEHWCTFLPPAPFCHDRHTYNARPHAVQRAQGHTHK